MRLITAISNEKILDILEMTAIVEFNDRILDVMRNYEGDASEINDLIDDVFVFADNFLYRKIILKEQLDVPELPDNLNFPTEKEVASFLLKIPSPTPASITRFNLIVLMGLYNRFIHDPNHITTRLNIKDAIDNLFEEPEKISSLAMLEDLSRAEDYANAPECYKLFYALNEINHDSYPKSLDTINKETLKPYRDMLRKFLFTVTKRLNLELFDEQGSLLIYLFNKLCKLYNAHIDKTNQEKTQEKMGSTVAIVDNNTILQELNKLTQMIQKSGSATEKLINIKIEVDETKHLFTLITDKPKKQIVLNNLPTCSAKINLGFKNGKQPYESSKILMELAKNAKNDQAYAIKKLGGTEDQIDRLRGLFTNLFEQERICNTKSFLAIKGYELIVGKNRTYRLNIPPENITFV